MKEPEKSPELLNMDLSGSKLTPATAPSTDETALECAERILAKYAAAFEELAK